MPGAKLLFLISSMRCLMFWMTSRALEPGRCLIMMEAEGLPSVMDIML